MKNKISVEENILFTSESYVESRKYWLEKLEPLVAHERGYLFFRSRVAVPESTQRFAVEADVSEKILKLCKGNDLSVYIYIVSAVGALIQRYTGEQLISLTSPGFKEGTNSYNSALPMVFALDPAASFKQRLIVIREYVLEVLKYQNYPVEKVIEELNLNPDTVSDILCFCPSVHVINDPGSCPFKVGVEIRDGRVYLDLSTTVELPFPLHAFFAQLHRVISVSVNNLEIAVDEIDILSAGDRSALLALSGVPRQPSTQNAAGGFRLIKMLRRQLSRGDNNIAVEYRGKTLSYAALDTLICKLCDFLNTRLRLSKGDRVVVMIDRSEWMLILPVALFQRGLVYVPIDVNNPEDRIRCLLDDVRPSLVITEASLFHLAEENDIRSIDIATLARALETCEEKALPSACGEDAEAYIIYTSGSTGKPKGAIITHGNLDHFFGHVFAEYVNGTTLDLPFVASGAFDISLFQLLTPVISGGKSIIVDKEQLLEPDQLLSLLNNATAIDTVPALYGQIVQLILGQGNAGAYAHIRRVFVGGDQIPDSLLTGLSRAFPAAVITVTYGPTEATMFCTDVSYPPGSITTASQGTVIGRPLPNGQVYILGEDAEILPVGMDGEICIGGPGVAKGYLKREDLTTEKFTSDPYLSGSRIYRTGDRGRWTPDGLLEFRGRKDNQVKIHGYRIELQEIENVMRLHPAVADAAVTVPPASKQERSLAGYFVKKRVVQVWPSISEYMGYNEVAYFAMNNDAQRVGSYRRAIEQIAKGNVIIDVGTGPEAILAQYCIQAGAVRVYAIELIEEAYYKAKHTVELLELEDKIIVIHGNIMDVVLPEKADYCICAIVGNMGSTDGCIPIMNSARKLLKDSSCMVPYRSVTKIAAVNLRDDLVNYTFTQTGAQYVKEIFEFTGGSFDLRIGLQNITEEDLISTKDIFEELDLSSFLPLDGGRNIELTITSDSEITGFVVWLNLHTRPDIVYDIFPNQKSFLPIYWPVFESPVRVGKGDRITARTWREFPEGMICPHLGIEGELIRADGSILPFYYLSRKRSESYSSGSFYSRIFPGGKLEGRPAFSSRGLQDFLKSKLPGYMVPPVLMQLEKLPLTANGKIDRQQLVNLNVPEEDAVLHQRVAPRNEVESSLALIWQNLLGVPQVGIHDNFFRKGGDSISTIQMVNRARRAGYELRVADIFTYPTIAGLASYLADQGRVVLSEPGEQGLLTGVSGLLPAQRWYFETNSAAAAHFNQSNLLNIGKEVVEKDLETAIRRLLQHHDALRYRYTRTDSGWQQEYGTANAKLYIEDLRVTGVDELQTTIEQTAAKYQHGPDIRQGDLVRFVWMRTPATESQNRLLVVIHHLVVDNVSWRILLEDLDMILGFLRKCDDVELGRKTTSGRQWFQALKKYGESQRLLSQLGYWKKTVATYSPLPVDTLYAGVVNIGDTRSFITRLSQAHTGALLKHVPRLHDTDVNDLLIAALTRTLGQWSGKKEVNVALEGHGREDIGERTDLSRTVGWLADIYPVSLAVTTDGHIADQLAKTRELLRQVPDKGIGYGVLKEINGEPALQRTVPWDIVFNFLGQLDNMSGTSTLFSGADESSGADVGASFVITEKLCVTAAITGGELLINWKYSHHHFVDGTIKELSAAYLSHLLELIHHCIEYKKSEDVYASVEYDLKANNAVANSGILSKKKSDSRTIMDF